MIKPNEEDLKKSLEKIIENSQYESFDDWISNFASNLSDIWNESSAKELEPKSPSKYQTELHSAIVIGRGPSIRKHSHLELLSNSQFKGSIVCCDGKLIDILKAGITPDKFPNFYVVTIDPYPKLEKFYDDKIVEKYGSQIKGLFTTISDHSVVNRARKSGITIHWFHSLFDLNEGKKSFNYISAQIVRAKKHSKGLPGIQTGGNVGTSAWFISWKILKCSNICLIGINHGWEEDDLWDTILSHGGEKITSYLDKNDPKFQKLFKRIFNPDFNCNCIMDPIFQFYSTALREFISRSPSWVNTINATEGGSIFGDRINCMKFEKFLKKY